MYLLLRKTEAGMMEISENRDIGSNKTDMAYVSGLGFGMMSGAFALVNVLADSVSVPLFILPCYSVVQASNWFFSLQFQAGPGTIGLRSGTEFFFVTSAAMTLCMILLNTFWSVIFNSGLDEKNYLKIGWVIASHFLVSSLSLLNRKELYAASILPSYIVLFITMLLAFRSAGGTTKSLIQSFYFSFPFLYFPHTTQDRAGGTNF